jgi:hypothetical protein
LPLLLVLWVVQLSVKVSLDKKAALGDTPEARLGL